MATWGEFQSVIQLSAAVNLVVFTLSQVVGNNISQEINRITEIDRDVSRIGDDTKESAHKKNLELIVEEINLWRYGYEYKFLRLSFWALVAFDASVIALFFSVILYGNEIDCFWFVLLSLPMLPSIIASIYVFVDYEKFRDFQKRRSQIFNLINRQIKEKNNALLGKSEEKGNLQ